MRSVLMLMIIGSVFLAGCGANPIEKSISEASNREILFSYQDEKDDGDGPGYYRNPTDYELYPKNTFDLTEFTVEDAGDYIYMKFRFNEEIHRDNTKFGRWDQILIDVYIDRDQQPYSGEDEPLPGREFGISEHSAWESVVMVSPTDSEWIKNFMDTEYEDTRTSLLYKHGRIIIPDFYIVGYNTITAKIPRYLLGTPKEWWGYQVAVMGYDQEMLNKDALLVNRIGATPNNRRFGGGSAYYGNPNVLDILDDGKEVNQKRILSDYNINPVRHRAKFSEIPLFYGKRLEGRQRLDISINSNADSVIKREKKKEEAEKQQDEAVKKTEEENTTDESLEATMRELLQAALKYDEEHPEDKNITLFDLMLSGYTGTDLKGPEDCVFKIIDQGETLRVECQNIDGEIIYSVEE